MIRATEASDHNRSSPAEFSGQMPRCFMGLLLGPDHPSSKNSVNISTKRIHHSSLQEQFRWRRGEENLYEVEAGKKVNKQVACGNDVYNKLISDREDRDFNLTKSSWNEGFLYKHASRYVQLDHWGGITNYCILNDFYFFGPVQKNV